jgi:hypothetical protein
MYKLSTYIVVPYFPHYLPTDLFPTKLITQTKPNMNSVEVHPQLHNKRRRVDVSWWVIVDCGPCRLALSKLEVCSRREGDKLLNGCVALNASYATSFLQMDLSTHFSP